jgi:hypothetical protein
LCADLPIVSLAKEGTHSRHSVVAPLIVIGPINESHGGQSTAHSLNFGYTPIYALNTQGFPGVLDIGFAISRQGDLI